MATRITKNALRAFLSANCVYKHDLDRYVVEAVKNKNIDQLHSSVLRRKDKDFICSRDEFSSMINHAGIDAQIVFLQECHGGIEKLLTRLARQSIFRPKSVLNISISQKISTAHSVNLLDEDNLSGFSIDQGLSSEHPVHGLKQWKQAVANDATRLGYGDWVCSKNEVCTIEKMCIPRNAAP